MRLNILWKFNNPVFIGELITIRHARRNITFVFNCRMARLKIKVVRSEVLESRKKKQHSYLIIHVSSFINYISGHAIWDLQLELLENDKFIVFLLWV